MDFGNSQWIFSKKSTHKVSEEDYNLVQGPIPVPKEGEILIKALYISVDPYTKLVQLESSDQNIAALNEQVYPAPVVGEVLESKDATGKIKKGQLVNAETGWQLYACCKASSARVIEDKIFPVSTTLGIMGIPGMTAYFGFLKLGKPSTGQTVVVSGAAGAVGSIVVQLAKINGCRVVGIAGTQQKIDYLTSTLGCDCGIIYKQYKTAKELKAALKQACPSGIDIYYDNVGGIITDVVMELVNIHARIIICGQISQYGLDSPNLGPRFLHHVLNKSATIQGVRARDWKNKMPEMMIAMKRWILEDKITYKETLMEGFESLPKALVALFEGFNTGKMIVKV